MFTYRVDDKEYIGFCQYNPHRCDIPLVGNTPTYIVICAIEDSYEIWVVQIGRYINGSEELARYYKETFGFEKVYGRFIRVYDEVNRNFLSLNEM